MTTSSLRFGYTTGACATAAAKGAALMLRGRRLVEEAEITLPAGITARFRLHGQEFTENFASCFVVKDAGDDPDVTHGAEIHARITFMDNESLNRLVMIEGGVGVGRVTKPGLAVPVGEWAINPVPRRMIEEAVLEVFPLHSFQAQEGPPLTTHVTISIPNGEELAQKTLNARLGIIGGLSILGTTGIVRPISAKAWTDTIDAAIDVALACGCGTIVLSAGRTSELVAQRYLGTGNRGPGTGENLNEEAFVMMGDHVGYALRACGRKGVKRVVLAGQFAKLLKIGCGHEQTHVSSSDLDLRTLAGWLLLEPRASHLLGPFGSAPLAERANTARQVLESSGNDPSLTVLVCGKALEFAKIIAPALDIKVLLAGYGGEVLYFG